MFDPFIIMCAPNGARRQKTDHSNIPLTPEELAACAAEVLEAGASMMHLHVRDEKGGHSLSVHRYQDAISAIRAQVGDKLVIQITTEAVGMYNREDQMNLVKELRPEAVSLALRELCPSDEDEQELAAFYTWMKANGIFPQTILYDQLDVIRFKRMWRDGVFATYTPFVLYVLGKSVSVGPEERDCLRQFLDVLPANQIPFSACGFQSAEYNLADKCAALGGHVRVGFENNMRRPDGSVASSNAELVQCAAEQAVAKGRTIATAADVRHKFM